MSFLSKLFGKGDEPRREPFDMQPTAEMMGEDRYWKLIADSLAASGEDQNAQLAFLKRELAKLPPKDIVGFRLRTDKLLNDTYNPTMWCAGYVMNGGCSDDMFEYFRLWVISRGREVYENARAEPDSLIAAADVDVPEGIFDFESFWYVANDAFKQTTGKDLYDYIDSENFKTNEANYDRDIEFNWTEDDPESMKRICPKLFEKFDEAA
jgi:hypothetical protein